MSDLKFRQLVFPAVPAFGQNVQGIGVLEDGSLVKLVTIESNMVVHLEVQDLRVDDKRSKP